MKLRLFLGNLRKPRTRKRMKRMLQCQTLTTTSEDLLPIFSRSGTIFLFSEFVPIFLPPMETFFYCEFVTTISSPQKHYFFQCEFVKKKITPLFNVNLFQFFYPPHMETFF